MKQIFVSLMLLLGLCPAAVAVTPAQGKVYRFENAAYPGYYLDANGVGGDVVVKTASTNRSQYWYCESAGVLRSLSTGYYLLSPDAVYTAWSTTLTSTTNNKFTFSETSGKLTMKRSNVSGTQRYLHADASHKCVCWDATSEASKWVCTQVSMTSTEISSILSGINAVNNAVNSLSTYQNALNTLFSDKACTQLKVTNPTANSAYSQLPEPLKEMVAKVQSGNWAEPDGSWDSEHARRFRVQEFKPYSRGQEAAAMLGCVPFTNMNNPTGIITVDSDVLYVMVDAEPATGSSLYIKPISDESLVNSYNAGTQLHAGLNILPSHGDCYTYYLYYTVDTYNTTSKVKNRRLSGFQPIKIHFEGGKLNGYWELGRDTNTDWEYYRTRAQHMMFDLLGRYVNLHMHFDETLTGSDYSERVPGLKTILKDIDVNAVLTNWDVMCLRERLLIGTQSADEINAPGAQGLFEPIAGIDYYDYFNNRIMACTGTGAIYMNSGNWRTQYNTNTMSGILTGMLWSGDGMWGPAHEFGHAMQEPMNFAGVSEVSNNIFSNVAVYCHGKYTSRAEFPSVHRQEFLNGTKFLDRSGFDMTRMFWQLFLYYHVAGHNRKFYPMLQELLRREPLQHPTAPSTVNERYDMLRFAKACCQAAGEDLTEFFNTWGFFIPFSEQRTDYSTFNLQLTQADANAVKQEIAALGLPKNNAIIFIDDRPGSARSSYPGFNKLMCGEFGGLDAFLNPKNCTASYALVGNNMIISGNPGAGIAIYDTAGNLLDFSNAREFTVSPDLAAKIKAGTAIVKAVLGNNSMATLKESPDPTPLYENIRRVLMLVDDDEVTVGMYRGMATYTLKKAYDDRSEMSYDELLAEYEKVVKDPGSRIALQAGKPYHLVSRAYTGLSMALSGNGLKGIATEMEATNQTWVPEAVNGGYALKNSYEGKYAGTCARSTQVTLTATPAPYTFKIMDEDNNGVYWAVCYNNDQTKALHIAAGNSNLVVGWDATAEPSQWIIRYMGDSMDDTGMTELREWTEKTRDLIAKVATVSNINEELVLTADMFSSNALEKNTLWGDAFTSWDVLLDNDKSTGWRTRYHNDNSDDGEDHYLQVDFGEGRTLNYFAINYSTRNTASGAVAPKTLIVRTSADGEEWAEVTTLSPTSPAQYPADFASDMLYSPVAARYVRLICTANWNNLTRGGHAPMGMSEFGMSTARTEISVNTQKYGYVTDDMVAVANDLVNTGQALIDGKSNAVKRLECIEALQEAYRTLYEAMLKGEYVGTDMIFGDEDADDAPYYDVLGRRITIPVAGGVYIHRGRKIKL